MADPAPEQHDYYWPLPRKVLGVPPVRQLSVGGTHVCAISEDARVWCWGSNAAGQLGVGDTRRRNVPTPMHAVTDAADVAASSYGPESHTCVLLSSDSVRCAGRNGSGELGRAPSADNALTPLEVPATISPRERPNQA